MRAQPGSAWSGWRNRSEATIGRSTMASVAQKLITAEEFALMPEPSDGSQQELVRGAIVTMPPPKGRHGACCSRVDRRVGNFVEANNLGHVCANDTGWILERDPDTV